MANQGLIVLRRFFWFTFFTVAFVAGTITVRNSMPPPYIYQDGDWDNYTHTPSYDTAQWNITFDPHSHSLASDGKLTPEQNIQWHIASGFNAMVLTDHNTYDNSEIIRNIARTKYNDSIKVLLGCEWTTSYIHLNVIFPPNVSSDYKTILPPTKKPSDEQIKNVITQTHALGGIVSINHMFLNISNKPNHPTHQELLAWGADYIESYNSERYDAQSYEFCIANGIGVVASTDMHSPRAVNTWTLMKASEFTEESIFNELKARRTSLLYEKTGTGYTFTHDTNPSFNWLKPLYEIGLMFQSYDLKNGNYNWTGIGILFSYLYGIFIVSELIRIGRKNFWDKRNKKKSKKEELSEKTDEKSDEKTPEV
jgi:PHP domain-containing protein